MVSEWKRYDFRGQIEAPRRKREDWRDEREGGARSSLRACSPLLTAKISSFPLIDHLRGPC